MASCGRRWARASVPPLSALPRFNGKLFKPPAVGAMVLPRAVITLLIEGAKADWTDVEPALFGTLLERALDPQERRAPLSSGWCCPR
ncbi:hypothetical protein PG1C_02515 [Rugosibacter aromaticivorans]|uniref:Uncharacterized protein n=1 Tax=Rugosibacter aromaticivorans TaxID=1565605 RepID=A0A0C5J7P2_9PROT|nr:hypothetical protein PG1C_02515 [Rugosibacter aromaticivorans]